MPQLSLGLSVDIDSALCIPAEGWNPPAVLTVESY